MKNKRALIVEDDVVTQRLYTHILNNKFGICTDIADSIDVAAKFLKNQTYDLYIVDMMLNGNVGGSALVNTQYRPMIVITGLHIKQKLKSVEYLQKPIDVDEFESVVKKLIED